MHAGVDSFKCAHVGQVREKGAMGKTLADLGFGCFCPSSLTQVAYQNYASRGRGKKSEGDLS